MCCVNYLLQLIFVLTMLAVQPYCSLADDTKNVVTVGSKNFTENRLLGEIMAQTIEAKTDLHVERRLNLGGTAVVFSALQSGDLDVYPEYTGTAWSIHLRKQDTVRKSLRAYVIVKDEFQSEYQIRWLMPFGFNNGYALAMAEKRAEELGIRTISDLKEHENTLRVGVSHEFLNREDAYIGLREAYQLQFEDIRGMEHGLAYEAIRSGEVDVVDTWTTDGKLQSLELTVLQDDRKFFSPYDAAPIISERTLREHPELEEALNSLAFRLTDSVMQSLNYSVEAKGGDFEGVAAEFLRTEGLVNTPNTSGLVSEEAAVGTMLGRRLMDTCHLCLEHLYLSLLGVFMAVLCAVPVGILLTRWKGGAETVMGFAGIIQTIPSLALLAFMIPIPGLGLGARSAIVALFLYALLPILRNTYTGIQEVDQTLVDAARGIGLKDHQILFRVELPLAIPTIMAGVRTATVIGIGVATLAAFIGAGGLGEPIITGLQLNDMNMVLWGAVPAAMLAVATDRILHILEFSFTPRMSS